MLYTYKGEEWSINKIQSYLRANTQNISDNWKKLLYKNDHKKANSWI